MATLKIQRRRLGAIIRQQTGLPLPVAMRAAREIMRGNGFDLRTHALIGPFVREITFSCGWECCGLSHCELVGPKGEYEFR